MDVGSDREIVLEGYRGEIEGESFRYPADFGFTPEERGAFHDGVNRACQLPPTAFQELIGLPESWRSSGSEAND